MLTLVVATRRAQKEVDTDSRRLTNGDSPGYISRGNWECCDKVILGGVEWSRILLGLC